MSRKFNALVKSGSSMLAEALSEQPRTQGANRIGVTMVVAIVAFMCVVLSTLIQGVTG